MKIARVFPTKTSMSPTDHDCYFGLPQLYMPKYDEVHISVTFTWDIEKAKELKKQWKVYCKNVKVGGPAFTKDTIAYLFTPGMYLKKGITITSRGCNNNCSFCLVKGRLKEINIEEGNILQDNNFLQCSQYHRSKVYEMLKTQKSIEFKGGLQSDLLTDWDIEQMRGLKIKELWFSCDHKNNINNLKKAIQKCKKYFNRSKLRCYVLIGDDLEENENRLKEVYNIGCLPFAQLYQSQNNLIEYPKTWKDFARKWSRPAIYKSLMEN
jgi:hypothetical protein